MCTDCEKKLPFGQFFSRGGLGYCESCYKQKSVPCGGCGEPILGEVPMKALDQHWHNACFKCAICAVPFGNLTYYEKGSLELT